jgi:serine/threonine protein kinase
VRQAIPFGKYLLLDRISVGGMAEVFKAKSYGVEGFEKVIAIKRILPSMGEDRDFIKMFIDEAKIAGQLAHANICQIFELGRIDGAHFIAMEFIWGKDLLQIQNRLRKLKQTMNAAMASFIVAKVCEGLDYAHRKKDAMGRPLEIVHRDCSPQNVLISYEGEVKIIDFGIAKAASRSSRTMHGVLKGKFGYMSPEQVRGLPLDRRSDLFALGTILYECLTGERLFQGDTDFATLEKVRNVDIVPPRQLNPSIPDAVDRIIMKALARDVDHRYQWCGEMLADLQAFLMAQPSVFTAKSLSGWMKEGFAPELEKERAQLESYKRMGRDGLIAGVPAAQAKLDVVEHLGHAGQSDDPTMLGGPSFDDIVNDGATQISAPGVMPVFEPAQVDPHLPAVAGEVAARPSEDRDFPEEEGPTTIFGDLEDENADTLSPADKVMPPSLPEPPPRGQTQPPVAHAPLAAPGQVGRTTAQSSAVPPPRQGAASPAARTLYGMAPPPTAPAAQPTFPQGTAPGAQQAYPQPPQYGQPQYGQPQAAYGYPQQGTAAPSDPTMMDMNASQLPVAQLVAQAQAELARARAEAQALQNAPQGPLPLQPGPPSGAVPQHQGYYPGWQPGQPWDPSQYPQYPHYPPNGQPVFTPSGVLISPPTAATLGDRNAMESTLPVGAIPLATERKQRRPSLGKDIAIGIGIAAVVLGLVAIVKFVVLGDEGGARRAEAATAGTIVVTAKEAEGAEVFIGGEKRGVVANGTLIVEKVVAGEHEVKVVKAGGDPCTQKVAVDGGETETIQCEFTPAVAVVAPDAAPADPAMTVDAGVAPATVAPDAAPAAAPVVAPDAAPVTPTPVETKPEVSAEDRKKAAEEKKKRDEERRARREEDEKKKLADAAAKKDAPRKTTGGTGATKTTKTDPKVAVATGDGYLVAYTTPWAKVVIDGKDTGKMTPIAPRAKIALPPGKHKVTFVVGRENWSYTVTIKAGETSKITKDLPVSTQ